MAMQHTKSTAQSAPPAAGSGYPVSQENDMSAIAKTTTRKTNTAKSTAKPAAENAKLPRNASGDAKLAMGKQYRPRPNTRYSTRQQWAHLQDAIAAGKTVQEIVNLAAANMAVCKDSDEAKSEEWTTKRIMREVSPTDAAYLDYVLRRGWVVVAK